MTAVLVADALAKEYEDGVVLRAVAGVSFTVSAGEVVLVMGPNGSGKTTLLSMLGGLVRPTSGEVLVEGEALAAMSAAGLQSFRLRRVGFVFQGFRLIDSLSAGENVQLVSELAGAADAARRTERILARLGAADLARRRTHGLSGGEKQRIAIARALVNEPAILLADEPTGSLDSAAGEATIVLLCAAARQDGRAVVIVSHDIRIAPHADRILRMADGRLEQ